LADSHETEDAPLPGRRSHALPQWDHHRLDETCRRVSRYAQDRVPDSP